MSHTLDNCLLSTLSFTKRHLNWICYIESIQLEQAFDIRVFSFIVMSRISGLHNDMSERIFHKNEKHKAFTDFGHACHLTSKKD